MLGWRIRAVVSSVSPVPPTDHRFYNHGFWRMSPGRRNLVHADGRAAVLVGDTAWGLPWRATHEQCEVYARDRQAKGFNAVLLMSVQPDMDARGPRDRSADEGFDVGFEDLPTGHINQLNPAYFQYLDGLTSILVAHEIVPVFQPVFFGFGWKGLRVAGPVLPLAEYARYCRYLVARYGARPAVYLVGGDGTGREPQVAAGGEEIERWDAYRQPTGIHYRPHIVANAHQDAEWLDFQWCQTGHTGEHIPERVADMWRNEPVKAVANGEPTYEHTRQLGLAEGWWQGHEAWSNLCAGGTFGVVYGAASLWQWAHRPDEPGQSDYFIGPGAGWREALDYEGSNYVGLVARILDGLPFADMQPNWEVTLGPSRLVGPRHAFHRLHLGWRRPKGFRRSSAPSLSSCRSPYGRGAGHRHTFFLYRACAGCAARVRGCIFASQPETNYSIHTYSTCTQGTAPGQCLVCCIGFEICPGFLERDDAGDA